MSENNAVRLSDDGPSAWATSGHSASRDDPFIRGLSEEYADYLVEHWGFEHVSKEDATPEPTMSEVESVMSGTLSELSDALETGEFDAYLDQLEQFERENKDREGAYERLDRRRDE